MVLKVILKQSILQQVMSQAELMEWPVSGEAAYPYRRAVDLQSFAGDSLYHYLEGAGWRVIHAGHGCWMYTTWGSVQEREAVRFVKAVSVALEQSIPYVSLFDVRLTSTLNRATFAVLGEYIKNSDVELTRFNRRHAVLRPQGFVGAAAVGYYSVYPSPYQRQQAIFESWSEVSHWLSNELDVPCLAPCYWQACRQLCERSAPMTPTLVLQLRELLRQQLPSADLRQVARQLGLSTRSLQRHLTRHATTFQIQVAMARIGEAQEMLLRGEGPLVRIALDVGYTCSQNFSRQFRNVTGLTPTQWRSHHCAKW